MYVYAALNPCESYKKLIDNGSLVMETRISFESE
jgi:hypothetical protein